MKNQLSNVCELSVEVREFVSLQQPRGLIKKKEDDNLHLKERKKIREECFVAQR